MDILGGWQIDSQFGIYRIPIRISHPETNISIIKYCLFDTGFTGYLGLDKESVSLLNLPKVGQGKGMTVKGLIEYENFQGIIEIIDQERKTLVKIFNKDKDEGEKAESIVPIQEFGIPIIGIKSIRQFSWLILFEKDALFLLK